MEKIKKSKCIVFGSFFVDLMARGPHMPKAGETVKGNMFKMGPGGKGFNQCVAAHKAGANVIMSTKLGKDTFKNVALDTMKALKMKRDYIFFDDKNNTGMALIIVDEKSGQNEIMIVPGSCNNITPNEVKSLENIVKDSKYVLLQLEINQDANEKFVALANKYKCKVIVNTAPYAKVSDDFLSKLYLVTPNEVEASQLTKVEVTDEKSAQKAANYFHKKGVENVIITLGKMGAYVSTKNDHKLIEAFKVKTVDTTGAGDAFSGGLLAALAEGKDLISAAVFGSAVAALSVQKLGTTPSMPTRNEIDAFLKKHKIK